MNYLNFTKPQFNVQNAYSTVSTSAEMPTLPKVSAAEAFSLSSTTSSPHLTEVSYYLSRVMSSIASVSIDARPLYTPRPYNSILNDISTLLPTSVEGYSLATSS
jgi:hypothetical protein